MSRPAPPRCVVGGTAIGLALAVLGFAALVAATPPDALQQSARPAAGPSDGPLTTLPSTLASENA